MADKEDKEAQRSLRKITAPMIKLGQDAYHRTAYCLTDGCSESHFYSCHETEVTSMVAPHDRGRYTFAHTIASSSQLAAIADGNRQVAWVPMRPAETYSKKPITSTDTIKMVLAFRGFCNSCDRTLFKSIDAPISNVTPEIAMLLAYRSFSYKVWRDEVHANTERMIYEQRETLADSSDQSVPPYRALTDEELAAAEAKRVQDKLLNLSTANIFQVAIKQQDYQRTKSVVFYCDELLPYRYSCTVWLNKDFLFRDVQINWHDCIQPPFVFVHALEVNGKSSIIVSWFDYTPEKYVEPFVDTIRSLSASGDLADALLRYAYINNHGFAADPDWIKQWPSVAREQLVQPVVAKVYQGSEIPATEIPTPKWSPAITISEEVQVVAPTDLVSRLKLVMATAKRDLSLPFELKDSEKGWLIKQQSKLFNLTYDHIEAGDFKSALTIAPELLVAASRVGHDEELRSVGCQAWKALSDMSHGIGDLDTSYEATLVASSFIDRLGDEGQKYALADLMSRQCNLLRELGKLEPALEVCNFSILEWISIDAENNRHKPRLASDYGVKATLCSELAQYDEARAAANACLSLLDLNDLSDLVKFASTSNNLAGIDTRQGDFKKAKANGEASLKAFEKLATYDVCFQKDVDDLRRSLQSNDSMRAYFGQF